jgi:predicted enzyme related to lactoylglutathione lyase
MPNLVFFEICVDDLDAAASFYSRVFGWEIADDEGDSWPIVAADDEEFGIEGALTSRWDEGNPTINTISVPSLEDCAKRVTEAGGLLLEPPHLLQGVGYLQYCHDLEGNAFAILEPDTTAGEAPASDETVEPQEESGEAAGPST